MLSEEKIRLMTGTALFEKRTEKSFRPARHQFKGDYISSHMIRSFILFTLTSMLVIFLWLLYRIDHILDSMDPALMIGMVKRIGIYYAAGLVIYLVITWNVYSRRYDVANLSLKVYRTKLRRLKKRYETGSAPRTEKGAKDR